MMISPVILGVMVTFIWAYLAVVVAMLGGMPPLEVLCFSATVGFVLASAQLTIQKKWHLIKAPAGMWLIGSICLFSINIFYISAFHFAPPIHVEIINYIWPLFVVAGGAIFFKEKLTLRHIAGIVICVLSLFVLHFDKLQVMPRINMQHMYGYFFALMAAVSCAVYVLVSKKHNAVPSQIVGMYAGVGAILSLIGHLLFESTVMPSGFELMMLITLGASSHWLAYQLWDKTIKRLKAWQICVITYFTPVLSVIMLIIAGFGVFSWAVIIACGLLFAGSILVGLNLHNSA